MNETIKTWMDAHPQRLPYGVEKIDGLSIVTMRRPGDYYESTVVEDAFVSEEWCVGGQTGGSCWDDGPHHYRGIEGSPEAKFDSLDKFLEDCFPQMTFIQYKSLMNMVRYHEYTSDHDYYGNYTKNMIKYLLVSDLGNVLDCLNWSDESCQP